MSETPQYWIAWLRELAEAQKVRQIAVHIGEAADCFAAQADLASEMLGALQSVFAIIEHTEIAGSPGSALEKVRAAIAKATQSN